MAYPSDLGRALNHLAWLRAQLGTDVNAGNAYAGALLTYNAAAALQWYFVLPTSMGDEIGDGAVRTEAANIIDGFVWRVRDLFDGAKRASKKALAGTAGLKLIKDLRAAIARILRRLPEVIGLPKPTPVQWNSLTRNLDAIVLIREWLASRGLAMKATVGTLKKAGVNGPVRALLETLTAASVVSDDREYGPHLREYRKGSAEVVSAMLRHALQEYVETLDGKTAKRLTILVEDIIRDIDTLKAV